MILNFSEMEEKKMPQFKGGEKEYHVKMLTDNTNKIMKGRLEPGASIGYHRHETDCEIIFIIEGSGKVLYDQGEERAEKGTCHYCPKGHSHSLINDATTDLIFYAAVAAQ